MSYNYCQMRFAKFGSMYVKKFQSESEIQENKH